MNQLQKQLILIKLCVFCLSFTCYSTTYYVSSEGNDDNPGTSESMPWLSLSRVNSFYPQPGDNILFRRGDEWFGTINLIGSGRSDKQVVYGAYGTGAKPKIYGSEIITGWTLYSGNIYKATFKTPVTQLFVDDQRIRVARYPDEGYHRVTKAQTSNSFLCESLTDSIDYSGAVWLGRTNYWLIENIKVAASSNKTITLVSSPSSSADIGEGFILLGKLEFLTQPGEWYYNSSTSTVFLWTPNGDSPENYTVRGSTLANGFSGSNKSYITIKDLEILQQKENGTRIVNSDFVTIENCHIHDQERIGISNDTRSRNQIIRNNVIEKTNCMGIWLWDANGLLLEDNTIQHIAQWNALGLDGLFRINAGSGMEVSGDNLLAEPNGIIQYNRIDDVGGCGMFFRRMKYVQYNHITYTGMIKDDGGAIYTNTSGKGSTIRYNICQYSIGEKEGYTASKALQEGIYIDEIAQDVIVEHNTIQNVTDAAIKLHNVGNIKVNHNTIMTARYGIWCNKYVGSPSPITNNTVYMTSNTNSYEPRPMFTMVGTYNTLFDYNKYFNPTVLASTPVFKSNYYLNFSQWKTATKQDVHSEFNSTPLVTGESADLIYNASKTVKKYNLNGAVVKDTDGNTLSGSFTLEPYTSVILIGRNIDRISEVADTIPPAITSFSVPSSATSLTVDVLSYTATDDIAVTGYMVTETSTPPLADETGWTVQVPASYKFPEAGTYTLYAWAKDAAGNVSEPASVSVNVHIPDYSSAYLEYLFEETSDTTVTDTQGFNDGTIINEATRKEGVKGNGLELSGMGYIDAGQGFADRVLDEVTLSAWVKPSAGSGGYQGLIVHGGQDSITFGLFLNRDLNSIAFKTSGTSSWWVAANDATELWDGGWHHVTVSYNGSEKTIYLDNVALKTVAATGAVNSGYGNNLLVGAGTDEDSPGLFYYGLIDEVRVFNYGLTASDVSDYYYSVVDTTTSVARYRNEKYLHFYPNPFKNHLTINTLETGKDITIDIFNASGSLIRSFTDSGKNMKPVIWDGRNENGVEVASGFYFIRLLMGNIVETGKVYKDR